MIQIRLIIILTILLFGCGTNSEDQTNPNNNDTPINKSEISESDKILQDAFTDIQSNLQVQGSGTVIRLLSDDLSGSKHQRFILKLAISKGVNPI